MPIQSMCTASGPAGPAPLPPRGPPHHGALHLLIHVVELQGFCHADLALMVPRELLGGRADAGRAGDILRLEPRGHRRPGGGRTGAGGTARAGAPFRSLTKTFQSTIAGSTIGSMLFEAHHKEEK